jgi:hypothetical protein
MIPNPEREEREIISDFKYYNKREEYRQNRPDFPL